MFVRPVRAAVVAGFLALAYVVAVFTVRSVPDAIVGMLGGPTGIERTGGLRLAYRPAPGSEEAVERYVEGASVRREGGALILEYPGVSEDAAQEITDVLGGGGLEFREVIEGDAYATAIGASDDVRIEVDQWHDERGTLHTDYFLASPSGKALQAAIDAAADGGRGAPAGTQIAFEWIDPRPDAEDPRGFWRTYLLSAEVAIGGSSIASATRSFDPYSSRPLVLLDFDREGGERFCELTGRIAGGKLATILGGRIRSAPIITDRICGGRASITMGGSDPVQQEREAQALVAVLTRGAVPPGGKIEDYTYMPPAKIAAIEWLGRLVLGVLFGAGFALLAFVAIRIAKPRRAPATLLAAGPFPWRRLAVTALAPTALVLGAMVPMPGVSAEELVHVLGTETGSRESLIALGVTPVIAAFVLVEVVALLITRLRWRRHDAIGRTRLGKAVVVVAVVIAMLQSYITATYYEQAGAGPFGNTAGLLVGDPGWKFRIVFMLSLTTASLLLAVLAGLVREHGLGNGYAILLASTIVIELVRPLFMESSGTSFYTGPAARLGMVTAATMAAGAVFVLRWRVATFRIPTSGVSPLGDTTSLLYLLITIALLVAGPGLLEAMQLVAGLQRSTLLNLGILVVSIPLWAWLFARPALMEGFAIRAGVEPPGFGSWLRATAVTVLFVGGTAAASTLAMLSDAGAAMFVQPLGAILVTATILDIIGDARARRIALVPAAIVHQVQHLAIIEQQLAAANIPYHLHSSHVRTLYAFFGPWAPVIVLVPAEHGEAARGKLDTRLAAFD